MSLYDNFDNLTVGETVIVMRSVYGKNEYQTGTVAKISKTQFVVSYGNGGTDNFILRTGKRVGDGDSWHPYYALRYTPENIQRMNRAQQNSNRLALASYLKNYDWIALSLDELQNIKAQLDAIKQEA
jgi:hypothetical protein